MPDVRSSTSRDTTPELIRLVGIHAVIIAVPVLVLTLLLLPVVVAVLLAVAVGCGVTWWRLRGIDQRVRAAISATPVPAHEQARLHNVVESAAMAVGVAVPSLHVIDSPSRNAITWGDGSGPMSTALTTGLLDAVDRVELEAVVGRQLTAARDASVEVVTVASALFGPFARGPLEELVASIVHRTVDDRGVVLADIEGARATGYPPGLVAALERVRAGSSVIDGLPAPLSALCFAAPGERGGRFDVHPPIEDRIDLLREI